MKSSSIELNWIKLSEYILLFNKLVSVLSVKKSPRISGHKVLSTPWSLFQQQGPKSMMCLIRLTIFNWRSQAKRVSNVSERERRYLRARIQTVHGLALPRNVRLWNAIPSSSPPSAVLLSIVMWKYETGAYTQYGQKFFTWDS